MEDKELKDILEKHRKWLANEEGGERANLSYTNLSCVDLSNVNLSGAILSNVNLSSADLCGVNLSCADLNDVDLSGANLIDANLSNTNLSNTNLIGTDLRDANLIGVNLTNVNLTNAKLSGANLDGANLSSTNLKDVTVDNYTTGYFLACPEKGNFIGFKKIGNYIIELEIPSNAKRSSATSRKCRCEFAKVLSITNLDGSDSGVTKITNNNFDIDTIYKVGEMVYPDSFDENRWNECSNGIHFFITREEAVMY